jgi:hypothetical protein
MKHSRSRREFLKALGVAAPTVWIAQRAAGAESSTPGARSKPARELRADVVVIGGGLGGCAAALAAARQGLRVIMTEETDWIGGQLTSQAVPPDENPWIETFGGTRSYLTFRQRVRDYYLRNYPVTAEARSKPQLNPGNGSVSRLAHEPRVAVAVLDELFAPYVSGHQVRILLRHRATAAEVAGDKVKAITVRQLESGREVTLTAPIFIDGTETGEVLPITRTEYVTGAESRKDTGEPHALETADPENMQSFTCCFAMDYLDGEDHVIERPRDYAFWRDYVPKLEPAWPGKLLAWAYSHPVTLKPHTWETDMAKSSGLFVYRRIADRTNFMPGTYRGDITLVNWPQNDYMLGNPFGGSEEEAARHIAGAKQLSLSLLYWLQTEAPRPDGGTGWKGLRLRPDLVGTEDGLAKYPYIRESRRIKAEFTVLEQHISTDLRKEEARGGEVKAMDYPDSVGIGSYRIDLHPSTRGRNYIDISSLPFQIPLGALLPQRVENLLTACKNLGVTHITNGCFRLHPVEWNIGEAAGALAAFCQNRKAQPKQVRQKPELLRSFQALLTEEGVPLAWPKATAR